jgi:ceramide glucosyltransferase
MLLEDPLPKYIAIGVLRGYNNNIMTIFFIFAVLVSLGIVVVVFQNIAIRVAVQKDYIVPEAALLSGTAAEGSASPQSSSAEFSPPISILKPLKGIDDALFDNLTSFCNQDYPEYEIIFALEEKNDPALKLAQKIKKMYPHRKISIVVKRRDYALNPKVNNLIPAYEASQFPYFLISDSDVRVARNYLREIIKPMVDPQVGLVSNLIRGIGTRSFGALLENLHLNSFVIGNVAIITSFFKMPAVVGKSMLMRKTDFDEIGGFEVVRNVLAEDYVLGTLMHNRGKRVVTSGYLVNAVNHHRTMKQFLKRHGRWGKLRWKLERTGYFSEIMTNMVFLLCFAPVMMGPTTTVLSLTAAAWVIKIMGDYMLGKRIGSAHHFYYYLLSPIKDIIVGLIWFSPFFSRTVVWRRHIFKVTKGSVLVPLRPLSENKSP